MAGNIPHFEKSKLNGGKDLQQMEMLVFILSYITGMN
jgi:hypothetical protein